MIRPQPKPVREIDEAYVAWIKALPCLVRNRSNCIGPVDPHHVVPVSKGGSDRTCVPLCRGHHDIANRRRIIETIDVSSTENGKEVTRYRFQATDFDAIDFPFALAKPQILDATQRAMALKIFDETRRIASGIASVNEAGPNGAGYD